MTENTTHVASREQYDAYIKRHLTAMGLNGDRLARALEIQYPKTTDEAVRELIARGVQPTESMVRVAMMESDFPQFNGAPAWYKSQVDDLFAWCLERNLLTVPARHRMADSATWEADHQ